MIADSLLPVVLGSVIGSFMLSGALRYPGLDGFAFGRSVCPACHRPIGARDLVPLVSWVRLRGRCRDCTAPIGWQYPAAELAGMAIALWAAAMVSGWLLWASCALGWSLLALALIDLRCHRLPDLLTLSTLIGGLAVTAAAWPTSLPDHVVGAVAGYGALAAIASLYRRVRGRDGLGLGDAKLLAAAGAWLSWQTLPWVVLIAAALALALAILDAAWRRVPLAGATVVPLGPYLGLAIWLLWLDRVADLAG